MRYLISLFFILLIIGCSKQITCNDFDKSYDIILRESKGNTLAIINALDKLTSKGQRCIKAYMKKGDLYFSLDNISLSAREYAIILSKDSFNTMALFKYGQMLQLDKKYDSSIYYFRKAISTKTEDGFVSDYPEIGEFKNNNSEFDVEYNLILYSLGETRYFNRELDEAKRLFSYCLKKGFDVGGSYFYLGVISLEMDKKSEACDLFSKASENGNTDANNYTLKYCK